MASDKGDRVEKLTWSPIKTVAGSKGKPKKDGEVAAGELPSSRSGHSMTAMGPNLFVFGGLVENADPPGPCDELWLLKMSSQSAEWHRCGRSDSALKKAAGLAPSSTLNGDGSVSAPDLPVLYEKEYDSGSGLLLGSQSDGFEDASWPVARWRHTATDIEGNRILLFGGFQSSSQRLNDVWVYHTVSRMWERKCYPPESAPNFPSPRGGHSAVLLNGKVWVYGGYGGAMYSGKDLDDVFILDRETWKWTRVAAKGSPPGKRSGHAALAVDNNMFILGGRSTVTEYADMHILDTEAEPPMWSQVEHGSMIVPRWHFSAYAVMSVPLNWKIFIFGGLGGDITDANRQGTVMNDVAIFDTGVRRWQYPETSGEAPVPRCDAQMEYYTQAGKLILYGGWANSWLGDCYGLDVGCVVGPPYAIISVTPDNGAITGGAKVEISGIDFINVPDVIVRFSNRKINIDVAGEFVNQGMLTCITPDFRETNMPPGTVDVRVSLGGESFTTTKASFTFFPVTSAPHSLIYGPGLLPGGPPRAEAFFVIQARDLQNQNRLFGGDAFDVDIFYLRELDDEDEDQCEDEEEAESMRQQRVGLRRFEDNGDGTYVARYVPVAPGSYKISVNFKGTFNGIAGPVRGSPCIATFVRGVSQENASMGGPLVMKATQADVETLLQFTSKVKEGIKIRMQAPTTSSGGGGGVPGSGSGGITGYNRMNTATIGVGSSGGGGGSGSNKEMFEKLVAVKRYIDLYKEKVTEMTFLLDRCTVVLAHLRRDSVQAPGMEVQISRVKAILEELEKEVPDVELRLGPLLRAQTPKLRVDIAEMEKDFQAYSDRVALGDFTQWEIGPPAALDLLMTAADAHRIEKKKMEDMDALAQMFDVSVDMVASRMLIMQVDEMFEHFKELWSTASECLQAINIANGVAWKDLQPEGLEETARELMQKVKKLHKEIRGSSAWLGLEAHVKAFLNSCPLIGALKRSDLSQRHWQELLEATDTDMSKSKLAGGEGIGDMKLYELLQLDLPAMKATVDSIADKALKEGKQEASLKALEETWNRVEFQHTQYKDTDVPMLVMDEEDFEALESDMLVVQTMVNSRYAHFKQKSLQWQKELAVVSDVVVLLANVQRMWSYLEPLFIHSEEVKKELPDDAMAFARIDKEVREMLRELWAARKIKAACTKTGLLARLEFVQQGQEKCKKSLSEYLQGKRALFPRFYFVSEADLLDILSNGNAPEKVMRHVDKIFLATKSLKLDKVPVAVSKRPRAFGFEAGVGSEHVLFETPVLLEGKVEVYLQEVLEAQRLTLGAILKRSNQRYPNQARIQWLIGAATPAKGRDGDAATTMSAADPAQIALLVAGINFTLETEMAIIRAQGGDPTALKNHLEVMITQLSSLVELTRSELKRDDRQRIMSLITLDAHARDVVAMLVKEEVTELSDFKWASQLKQRYAGDEGHSMHRKLPLSTVDICDARFEFGYEFLGNGPRLVITPLTDRIYVTATQALHLKMGCAPSGPAGTGKTETTKDLAAALGKCCYVFNCSPEMDYQSLGDIFKGLASSGSWGCFDEFNRLIPEVLSVCSLQFKAVTDGLKAFDSQANDDERSSVTIVIEGQEVSLDPGCGAFITMNPGYLGRSELPEGLKVLFRPITVMVPDLVLICENMLMAEGFIMAKVLASKFYGLYSLLRELLSKQDHYDWGLRAVKSVLVVAGLLKRMEPNLPEDALLMRALRDFNTPKIVKADEDVFHGLLKDLFSGLDPPRLVNESLVASVKEVCDDLRLWPDDAFALKVCQLDELLAIRHCNFIMGPAGAGKSACWKVLREAKSRLDPNNKVKVVDINPKTVHTEELYGHISLATRQWKDGLLSSIMRDLASMQSTSPKWMVLDGDLDANWIESMNSVMDDNKMLTLASNERIPLKAHMRMIFEIRDLKFATPATVSRAGILYISTSEGTQWRSMVASWVMAGPYPDQVKGQLADLFERYLPKATLCLTSAMKCVVDCEPTTAVSNLLQLLEGLIESDPAVARAVLKGQSSDGGGKGGGDGDDDGAKGASGGAGKGKGGTMLEHVFVFCAIWAFGAVLTVGDDGVDYRKLFSDWWRSEFTTVKIPKRDTVFDYYLSTADNTYKFDTWKTNPVFRSVAFDSSTMSMSDVTVPTAETASVTFWMMQKISRGEPVMLVGPSGTGKTQLVMGGLRQLAAATAKCKDGEVLLHSIVNMNYYTSAAVLQTALEGSLQKKAGANFGPPGTSKMAYFVDDLNLPALDPYNTQSAIALIRQHLDYGHWYDAAKLQPKTIANCQYVAAMNPTAGSFRINPRLQRHFMTFAVGMPSPTSLLTIFETFLEGHLRNNAFETSVLQVSANLIKGALSVHHEVSEAFRKTAANFHYEFNIRHLTNVFKGLLMCKPALFIRPDKLVYLWLHESDRVYGDRLVSREDIDRFRGIMANQAKKVFPQYNAGRFFMGGDGAHPLIFNFNSDGDYDQVDSLDALRDTLEAALADYNDTHPVMDLVLFNEACLHVARISRILLQPGGHCMLVGVGGSGKQSLSRLAVSVAGLNLATISITKGYGISDFKADLQAMAIRAGAKGNDVAFLFMDNQIVDERCLVCLNDLLSSGNVPDLFTKDEQQSICDGLADKVRAEGLVPDPSVCWEYFLKGLKHRLHIVLAFSPMGGEFRNRARKFPALVSCTVIDWFQPWPREALASVGRKFLGTNAFLKDSGVRLGVENFMMYSFESVNNVCKQFLQAEGRHVYTTPKTYLEKIKLFTSLLQSKHAEYSKAIQRLDGGVIKLAESAEAVAHLEANLKMMLGAAEEKREQADKMADAVREEKEQVEIETAKANEEAQKVAVIQAEVSEKQSEAESELAKAEPAVIAAMSALDTLDKKELGQCKTMIVPPTGVGDVFVAVMVLLANMCPTVPVSKQTGKVRDKDRTWDSVKKSLLGNINGFIEELKGFKGAVDSGRVPAVNMRDVRDFLVLEHFSVDVIEKRNSAAAGLCSWVLNIVNYYDIVCSVEPKRKALKEANAQLDAANVELDEVRGRLKLLEERLAILTEEFVHAEAEKKEAQDMYERGRTKLELAQRLVRSLGGESDRWSAGVSSLRAEKEDLVGDVLIASAFLSYVGPFTRPFRELLVHKTWLPFLASAARGGQSIPMSAAADPVKLLANEADIAKWNTQGLPADSISSENGAIVCGCVRWPLLVDPQLQGLGWVKNKESGEDRHLSCVRLGEKDMLKKLSSAMENGWSVIIENMGETIEPMIMPVVVRAVIRRGASYVIRLGDEEIDLHQKFRLFLHTKLLNPHFPPEIQAETTIVNFMVTPGGLEDQLLSVCIRKERPDLASHKTALLQQSNEYKVRIRELEDDILARLAESAGDITEDRELIEGLEESKRLSVETAEKLREMKIATDKINVLSEEYRPVARRGSLLFFVINDLHKINSLYMYSLNSFVVIYQSAIDIVNGISNSAGAGRAKRQSQHDGGGGSGAESQEVDEESGRKSGKWGAVRTRVRSSVVESFGWNQDLLATTRRLTQEECRRSISSVGAFLMQSKGGSSADEKSDTASGAVLVAKVHSLKLKITEVVYNYVRRGLLEKDKLTVATVVALRVMQTEQGLEPRLLQSLLCPVAVEGRLANYPEEARRLTSERVWKQLLGIEALGDIEPRFQDLGERIVSMAEEWAEWMSKPAPEESPMPGEFENLGEMQSLVLLRLLRPDRVIFAFQHFVGRKLGKGFIAQAPFDVKTAYHDSSASTPILFFLFPGVDPTSLVEELGESMGIGAKGGLFCNISMGQGQEKKAEAMLSSMAQKGGWVMLQNVHLMQAWLPQLDSKLEALSGDHTTRADFRCFISAEPPPLPDMKNVPEALLQACVKVANEAPADLKSNLRRAWAVFNQAKLDEGDERFRACLFGLCFFHSLVLGRRRFGRQGWSRPYGFNTGDLTICANVLQSYLAVSGSGVTGVPWQDLRYIFGEIMYGGHITDFWDRRVTATYLQVIFNEGLLKQVALAPRFGAPDPAGMDYELYADYIERSLPDESPAMFGMAPNAEVGYLTSASQETLDTLLHLDQGGNGGANSASASSAVHATTSASSSSSALANSGGAGGGSTAAGGNGDDDDHSLVAITTVGYATVDSITAELLPSIPAQLDLLAINKVARHQIEVEKSEQAPYFVVALQEVSRMNALLSELNRSLVELVKGLNGQLNMTQAMEDLQRSLALNLVPGRNVSDMCSWEAFAWPSRKSLSGWLLNLQQRVAHLRMWTGNNLRLPPSLWLPGLFNPTAFLTAVKQVTAHRLHLPLDQMTVETRVTCMRTFEEARKLSSSKGGSGSGTTSLDGSAARGGTAATAPSSSAGKIDTAEGIATGQSSPSPAATVESGFNPPEGALIHGLYIEGARWRYGAGDDEDDRGSADEADELAERWQALEDRITLFNKYEDVVRSDGHLAESSMKDLIMPMPVIYAKAVQVKPEWEPTAVGYLRADRTEYNCPVYLTSSRGQHFIFTANLTTNDAPEKWVISGASLILETDS